MKKVFKILMLLILITPMVVNADSYPIAVENYANQGTLGSSISLDFTGWRDFDGSIEYDNNVLDYVSAIEKIPTNGTVADSVGEEGTINIVSNDSGKLTFKYEKGSSERVTLHFVFRVKSIPESKKTTLIYIPNNTDVIYGSPNVSREYELLPSSGVIEICDKQECETKETIKEVEKIVEKEVEKATPLTYAAFSAAGVFLLAFIITLIKKK